MAAVEGNGQRELLRAVAGIAPRPDVRVEGTVAFVPEDRAAEGLVPDLSLTENIVLGLGADAPWIHGPLVDWSAARRRTAELMAQHDVRAAGPDAAAHSLSGGNQQKVIMARAFDRHPEVLVAENPTRGLDIRATGGVHRRLREAAASGMAVLVWSSDLDEVLELADRVLVVHGGVVREAPRDADRGQVGRMMLGLTGGER
jgi:simple sugar transport system ATP-binding protein